MRRPRGRASLDLERGRRGCSHGRMQGVEEGAPGALDRAWLGHDQGDQAPRSLLRADWIEGEIEERRWRKLRNLGGWVWIGEDPDGEETVAAGGWGGWDRRPRF